MNKPTDKQVEEFWIALGFEIKNLVTKSGEIYGQAIYDSSGKRMRGYPSVDDLNNLFEYAVPIITERYGYHIKIQIYAREVLDGQMGRCAWADIVDGDGKLIKSFALEKLKDSLFWAIWGVIK